MQETLATVTVNSIHLTNNIQLALLRGKK